MINVRQTMYKQRETKRKQCTKCFCLVFVFPFIDTVELYTHNWDFHLVDHFEYTLQHEPKKKERSCHVSI